MEVRNIMEDAATRYQEQGRRLCCSRLHKETLAQWDGVGVTTYSDICHV